MTSANSSRLSPACSRNAWTIAPNVRKLSDDSTIGHLPRTRPPNRTVQRPSSRHVTGTVQRVTTYARAAYAARSW
ncbi:hypothetical protein SGFS_074700 [Streptomyces graminofaciens]|uniref:Uncharacterized protein n=1 Tax=Streptomyces graminofaciens TaxID=68212 RepID=A0ABN5VRR4_9ACTN|nr:hypothetical protein SGFS_074700 [Streptomyces graminofaciens]